MKVTGKKKETKNTPIKKRKLCLQTRMNLPVCKGNWRDSQINWIVCKICTMWAHNDCSYNEF